MSVKPEALRWAAILEHQANHDGATDYKHKAAAELRNLHAENERLREALRDTTLHLGAAVDLLKRGGRKAVASDKMFVQMLTDYTKSFERGRAALRREET